MGNIAESLFWLFALAAGSFLLAALGQFIRRRFARLWWAEKR